MNIQNMFIFGLSLFIMSICITHIQNYFYTYPSKETLFKDNHRYLLLLDHFYIKNKIFTITCVILYIVFNSLIFVFLRYLYLGDNFIIIPTQENISLNFKNIFKILMIYLSILIIFVLYRSFLNLLFKKEINKFLIYISSFHNFFNNFQDFIKYDILDRILGTLREFFYRTSNQTYKENLFPFENYPDEVDDEGNPPKYMCYDSEYDYQVTHKYLIALAYATQEFLKTHKMIKKIFKFIARILRFLHVHTYILKYYFPYFIIILSFLYDVYNKEIKFTYIALFIWIIIKLQRDLENFIGLQSYYTLGDYFYNNDMPYETQRIFLFQNKNITVIKEKHSIQNSNILGNFYKKRIIEKIIDKDFGWNMNEDYTMRHPDTPNFKAMHRRVYVILIFIIIYLYIYFQNIYSVSSSNMLLLIILTILTSLIFTHYQTFHTTTYEENYESCKFIYNKKYNILFWLIVIIQTYLFWLIIFYPQLILLKSEILFNSNIITISKIFSQEEKIIYLYQYFDYYMNSFDNERQEYLRHILRQIDFKPLISENISFKDIQIYIKFLVENYMINEISQKALEIYIYIENMLFPSNKIWYKVIKGLIIGGALVTVIGTITLFYATWCQLQTATGLQKVISIAYKGFIKTKVIPKPPVNILHEITNILKKIIDYFF